VLFLGDDVDSTIGRVRLSTDVALNELLDNGTATLVCLCANKYSADWAATAAGYASNWVVGCSENLTNVLDLRALPCCYWLDGQRVVVSKSLSVEALMSAVNPNY
jgi:hypothetical protein